MNARSAFLDRVRAAVVQGNKAGHAPQLPERGAIGYQGAGPDSVQRFCQELKNAGGFPHIAKDSEEACRIIRDLISAKEACRIVIGTGGMIEDLSLAEKLRRDGLTVSTIDELRGPGGRDTFFAAEVGISNVAYLVAETGSVIMASGPDEPRFLSLLPPVHIAVASRNQILPDLFDLFDAFSPVGSPDKAPPPCLTVITGPSKTGDIELKLVTGVHGPGEIHVVVCGR